MVYSRTSFAVYFAMQLRQKENEDLVRKVESITSLLAEAYETIGVAIGVEVEYGDYAAAEKLKDLRKRVEKELTSNLKDPATFTKG